GELRRAAHTHRRPAPTAWLPGGGAVRVDAAVVAAVTRGDGRAARHLQRVGSVGGGPRGAGAARLPAPAGDGARPTAGERRGPRGGARRRAPDDHRRGKG